MKAVKLTHFGARQLPDFGPLLAEHRQPIDGCSVAPLIGINSDGIFKTAISKEYPDRLCYVIAMAFAANARGQDHHCEHRNADFANAQFTQMQ